MHVVINGRFLGQATTGVQRYAREVVEGFDKNAAAWPDMTFELLVPRDVVDLPAYENIAVRRVGRLGGHLWEQLELPFHAKGDVLFCPGNTAPIASRLKKPAIVVTVHDLSYKYFPAAYSRAFRLTYAVLMPLVLRLATRLITVSHAEATQMLRYYPGIADRLHVVPNGGMPTRGLASPAAARPERPYALYVGSFSKRKNFDVVMDVASRLVAERPDLDFVFVGDRSKIFEADRQIDSPLASRLKFTGQVDDLGTLVDYYRNAAVFVFPSLYESSGLPPIEAMACHCPVVVSDIPAHRERCGTAAIFCDPRDPNDIYAAVRRVVDDPRIGDTLRSAGLERAREFTWESCAAKTIAVMRGLGSVAAKRESVTLAKATGLR